MRMILGLAIGGVVGAAIGHWGFLCPGGTCPITGSWYGGGVFGGLLGLILSGGCPWCATTKCKTGGAEANSDQFTGSRP